MKQRIDASMIKLKMVTFQFRNEDSTLTTGLINWARYNIKTNEIEMREIPGFRSSIRLTIRFIFALRLLITCKGKSPPGLVYLPRQPT